MKPFHLVRYVLLLVTLFTLMVSANGAALPQAGEDLSKHASHGAMMMEGTHCDGCPSGVMPPDQNVHCSQCQPWLPVTSAVPVLVSFEQRPFLSFQPLPAGGKYPSLPWKPPRHTVLNA